MISCHQLKLKAANLKKYPVVWCFWVWSKQVLKVLTFSWKKTDIGGGRYNSFNNNIIFQSSTTQHFCMDSRGGGGYHCIGNSKLPAARHKLAKCNRWQGLFRRRICSSCNRHTTSYNCCHRLNDKWGKELLYLFRHTRTSRLSPLAMYHRVFPYKGHPRRLQSNQRLEILRALPWTASVVP